MTAEPVGAELAAVTGTDEVALGRLLVALHSRSATRRLTEPGTLEKLTAAVPEVDLDAPGEAYVRTLTGLAEPGPSESGPSEPGP